MRILMLTVLFFAVKAIACSCIGSDLQGKYHSSANVFTAVVTNARFDDDGNIAADLEVKEIFKGDVPFDRLSTIRSGTSCDATITVGVEYLFFMGEEGRFGSCSGNRAIVPGKPTPWLDLLRAYKAGTTPDLSSPWEYHEHDGLCTLKTDFRSTEDAVMSGLRLEYRYAVPKNPRWAIEDRNIAGYSSAVFRLPAYKEPVSSWLTIKTPNRTFVARWSEDALPGRRRGAFQLTGEDVRVLAQELLAATQVRLEGSLTRYPNLDGTVIRTTNAGTAISEFVVCASP